jgi:hypothetical protein
MDGHEEFRELCVISLSGELTREATARLAEHLRTCASCEKIFHQYRATVLSIVPQLTTEGMPSERVAASSWEVKAAETVLFEHLKTQERDELSPECARSKLTVSGQQSGYIPPTRWKEFAMLYAAGILLFLALTTASYRLGTQRGTRNTAPSVTSNNSSDQNRPDYEHDRLVAEVAARDKTISGLKKEIASKGSGVRQDRARLPAGASPGGTGMLSGNECL